MGRRGVDIHRNCGIGVQVQCKLRKAGWQKGKISIGMGSNQMLPGGWESSLGEVSYIQVPHSGVWKSEAEEGPKDGLTWWEMYPLA